MNPTPAMFQYVRKLVGANNEKQVAFAPLTTPFTNEDFLFLNTDIYKTDPSKYYSEAHEFSKKANSIIKKPYIWEIETEDFLYVNYDKVLSHARLIANRDLTEDEIAARETARKVLYISDSNPTPAFMSYNNYEQQYKDIVRKIEDHNNSKPASEGPELNTWNSENKQMQDELKAKELEWNALGFKVEIEKAKKAFDKPKENSEREEFAAKWQDAKNLLSTVKTLSAASGGDIYPMECIPNNLYEYKGTSWIKVNLGKDEINQLTDELKQNSGNINTDLLFGNDIELDSLSFEICRVMLSRSWFLEDLLFSKYWNYPDDVVSSGENDNYTGLIPAYPIEFVLVKNVNPTLSANSAVNENLKNNLKSGVPVFMGPFVLKSQVSKDVQNSSIKVQTFTNNQLHFMKKAFTTAAPPVAEALTVKKDVGFLGRMRVMSGVSPIVRDHRHGEVVVTPDDHAGFVWVVDHWERQRAEDLNKAKLTGKILDENNEALPDADIALLNKTSMVLQNDLSDLNGQFSIENIQKGEYHLTVRKEGYSTTEKELSVQADLDTGTINLSSLHPVESFLLLGVVYKKLPALPNPIPNEIYQ
jgi:hypothetical protein